MKTLTIADLFCGADRIVALGYPIAFNCGTLAEHYRTLVCNAREPLFIELQTAKARIESIVKVGDAIIENGSVSDRMADEWNKAKGGA